MPTILQAKKSEEIRFNKPYNPIDDYVRGCWHQSAKENRKCADISHCSPSTQLNMTITKNSKQVKTRPHVMQEHHWYHLQ